jgi:hypothetical protein
MDNPMLEIAKFLGGLAGAAATCVKLLGDRQARANRKIFEKLSEMDKENAQERARADEDVKRLREKVDQERLDFKETLKEITNYMYNRPR